LTPHPLARRKKSVDFIWHVRDWDWYKLFDPMLGATMQQILVGRFRDPKDAEVAMSLLVADGIPAGDIKFKSHDLAPASFCSEDTASNGLLHGLGNFFDRLFGAAGDSEDRDYAEPVPPGGAVIVVTVHRGEKSQRAHAALADMGATEIERR
jgi:hypothetical protein